MGKIRDSSDYMVDYGWTEEEINKLNALSDEELSEAGWNILNEATLADYIIRNLYGGRITSPFIQLAVIEAYESRWKISYNSISRKIAKETKTMNRCISCLKICDKPCHTINIKNISYIRRRKKQEGTGKGNTHLNKKSPKGVSIEALLNAMDGFGLTGLQKDNIKKQFKDLKPELLTLFTGITINTFDEEQTEYINELLMKGLYELLPDREKDFIKTGKPPKYKSKIDIKDYVSFWNSANKMRYLKKAFQDVRLPMEYRAFGFAELDPTTMKKALIPTTVVGAIPFPCERDKDWYKQGEFKWVGDGWHRDTDELDKTMLHRLGMGLSENHYKDNTEYTPPKKDDKTIRTGEIRWKA